TVGGAVYGGAIGVLMPQNSGLALFIALAVAVAPLVLIATVRPSLAAAPITAVIVLLVPTFTHAGPVASAVDRVLEVAVGAITGFAVSFVLLPSSAYGLAVEIAVRTLDRLEQALSELLAGLTQGLDVDALHRIQDGIGQSLVQLGAIAGEAERERLVRLVA